MIINEMRMADERTKSSHRVASELNFVLNNYNKKYLIGKY